MEKLQIELEAMAEQLEATRLDLGVAHDAKLKYRRANELAENKIKKLKADLFAAEYTLAGVDSERLRWKKLYQQLPPAYCSD